MSTIRFEPAPRQRPMGRNGNDAPAAMPRELSLPTERRPDCPPGFRHSRIGHSYSPPANASAPRPWPRRLVLATRTSQRRQRAGGCRRRAAMFGNGHCGNDGTFLALARVAASINRCRQSYRRRSHSPIENQRSIRFWASSNRRRARVRGMRASAPRWRNPESRPRCRGQDCRNA